MLLRVKEVFMLLVHRVGEAQVDSGVALAKLVIFHQAFYEVCHPHFFTGQI